MAGDSPLHDPESASKRNLPRILLGALLLLAGLTWIGFALWRSSPAVPPQPAQVLEQLESGSVAGMDSPVFNYEDSDDGGWHIGEDGADPAEPRDPWDEPAGVVTFDFTGGELALNLALGNYWAYLYVTVDGEPANLLSSVRGNVDSTGESAGYRTFYAPEKQTGTEPVAEWVSVHRDKSPTATHRARIEIWRGWGQIPLRGVAVDALPVSATPVWPGVLLALVGAALYLPILQRTTAGIGESRPAFTVRRWMAWSLLPGLTERNRVLLAGVAAAILAFGVSRSSWLPTVLGFAGLGLLAVARPALWTSTLLFALPFYFTFPAPILPNRDVGLIDAFVLLGLPVVIANRLLEQSDEPSSGAVAPSRRGLALALTIIVAWALVSTSEATYWEVALREWRTVFLYAGLFAILLYVSLSRPYTQRSDLWLIVGAWIGGGVAVAAAGLFQYLSGDTLISAEGVQRIRGFYGSPNNLALYLERTFLVTLALAAFLPAGKPRIVLAAAAAIQAVALVLTFSKGALLIGIPAGLLVLWAGGLYLLPRMGRSRTPLIWLAAAGTAMALILLPFLNTERFRGLLDFTQGTGYLRILLWRSAWQMALDHALLGVGPDNFLYSYRSLYILPEAWQEPNLNHPHNWILDWWTRIGLPGLVIAATWFAVGLNARWRTASAIAASQPREAVLSLGFLAAIVAGLAHGLIDASFALPDLMLVWVLILMARIELPVRSEERSGNC